MKARKKPVVIDFHPADKLGGKDVPEWVWQATGEGKIIVTEKVVSVQSKEGWVTGPRAENMIMYGVRGELYLCDKEIFDETYEVLTDEVRDSEELDDGV